MKSKYITPEITVVEFKVESGFASSTEELSIGNGGFGGGSGIGGGEGGGEGGGIGSGSEPVASSFSTGGDCSSWF